MAVDLVNVPTAPTVSANGNGATPPSIPAPRTIVTNGRQLADLLTEALEVVQAANVRAKRRPVLFVRGGQLARVVEDEDGRPAIALVDEGALLGILAGAARWETATRPQKEGDAPRRTNSFPPAALVKTFLSLGQWPGLPPLAGLVHGPHFDAQGKLHAEPGYNRTTGLYNAAALEIGDTTPTAANVAAARALLDELLEGFPFADDASRAQTIGYLLLAFLRPMIPGPTPLHAFTAPTIGTGKTKLPNVCALVGNGRGVAAMTAGKDEAEWDKRLLSLLATGATSVLIDNVTTDLTAGPLAAVLTATEYTGRALGQNRMITVPVRCAWAVTGNNLTPSAELARRMVRVRLDANAEKPWQREGFKHPNLEEWATENRGKLAGAAVTLIRNWIENAGRAPFTAHRKGSYEAWARTVGGVLEAAGVPGFLANDDDFYAEAVTDVGAWRAFVEAWYEAFKLAATPTADLFRLASHNEDARKDAPAAAQSALVEAEAAPEAEYLNLLGDLLGDGKRASRTTRLGKALHAAAGRVFATDMGTFKIARAGERRGKPRWNLVQLAPAQTPQAPPSAPKTDAGGVEGARNPLPHPLPPPEAVPEVAGTGAAENLRISSAGVEGGRGLQPYSNAREEFEKSENRANIERSANPLPPSTPTCSAGPSVGRNGAEESPRIATEVADAPAVPAQLAPYFGRGLPVRELETALALAGELGVTVQSKPGRGGWWLELA